MTELVSFGYSFPYDSLTIPLLFSCFNTSLICSYFHVLLVSFAVFLCLSHPPAFSLFSRNRHLTGIKIKRQEPSLAGSGCDQRRRDERKCKCKNPRPDHHPLSDHIISPRISYDDTDLNFQKSWKKNQHSSAFLFSGF